MNEKEIIREVMKMRGWSQQKLADEAGFPGQTNITGLLNNNKNGIRLDKLFIIMKAMGCEIIIRDKMGTNKEWKIEL